MKSSKWIFLILFLSVSTHFSFAAIPLHVVEDTIQDYPKDAFHLLDFWTERLQIFQKAVENRPASMDCFERIDKRVLPSIIRLAYRDYSHPYLTIDSFTLKSLQSFLAKVSDLKTNIFQIDFKLRSQAALYEFKKEHQERLKELSKKLESTRSIIYPINVVNTLKIHDERFSKYFEIWEEVLLTDPILPDLRPISESPMVSIISHVLEDSSSSESKSVFKALKRLKETCKNLSHLKFQKIADLWSHLPQTRIQHEGDRFQFLFDDQNESYTLGDYTDQDSVLILEEIQHTLGSVFPKDPKEPELFSSPQVSISTGKQELLPAITPTILKETLRITNKNCPDLLLIHKQTYSEVETTWKNFGFIETINQQDCFRLTLHGEIFQLGCYPHSSLSVSLIRKDLNASGLNCKTLRKIQQQLNF